MTDDLLKKENIRINMIKVKYEGYYSFGFLPPKIIIYEEEAH
jgi:hypothetical protein